MKLRQAWALIGLVTALFAAWKAWQRFQEARAVPA